MHPSLAAIGKFGAAVVCLAAALTVAAAVHSVGDYWSEYGSRCGTGRLQVVRQFDLWVPSLSMLSAVGWALSALAHTWPRTCRTTAAVTLLVCVLTYWLVHGGLMFLLR